MLDLIYVHIDVTSNAILAKGITHEDFNRSIVHLPKNVLLLNPAAEDGEHDVHTGFKVVREPANVQQYFQAVQRKKSLVGNKWIDFSDITMLKELTPLEISELLYFGHTKTSLHSPFFYKLQNNFAFFELMDCTTKIYYRYIDEFYRLLSIKITRIISEKVNERISFFRRNVVIKELDTEHTKMIKPILQEGVVFCFDQIDARGRDYYIPIYVIEDALQKTQNEVYKKEPMIALMKYNSLMQVWEIIQEGPELVKYKSYA